ncbi:MAG TPA: DUF6458 family protein [Ilumatobacter sp.]|nr:DUF6458 family protein [Ilumatobacter sp.]
MYAALGLLLLVGGAILTFAIDRAVDGANLETIGWILMGGGALALIIAAIQGAGWMSMSSRRTRVERHVSPDGNHVYEDQEVR